MNMTKYQIPNTKYTTMIPKIYLLYFYIVLIFYCSNINCYSNIFSNKNSIKNKYQFAEKKSNQFAEKKSNQFELISKHHDFFQENQIKFFGFDNDNEDKFESDKFYFIIGEKNKELDFFIEKLVISNYHGIYVSVNMYTDMELNEIIKTIINNDLVKKPKKNIFWIFDEEKYIGGLFDIYSIIFKEIC